MININTALAASLLILIDAKRPRSGRSAPMSQNNLRDSKKNYFCFFNGWIKYSIDGPEGSGKPLRLDTVLIECRFLILCTRTRLAFCATKALRP